MNFLHNKKMILKTGGIFALVCLLFLSTGFKQIFAGSFLASSGLLYVLNGGIKTVGNSSTANSFAVGVAYRSNIAGQSMVDPLTSFNSADGTDPAVYSWDVGSSAWTTTPAAGDIAMGVFQTYNGQVGFSGTWTGVSFVGGDRHVITDIPDLSGSTVSFDSIVMEPVPTPLLAGKTASSLTIHWTGLWDNSTGASGGIAHNSVVSYSLYRSVNGGAYQVHGSPYAVVAQSAGQNITYTDTSVTAGQIYKYKLTVNFLWANHTPAYFETTAAGPESGALVLSSVIHHFDFVLTSPQNMDSPFTGNNTITAKDVNNDVILDYSTSGGNVTITENTSLGTVTGFSGAGNVLLASSFVNGVANLTGTMVYGGTFGSRQFKATAGAVNSLSNSITINQGVFAKLSVNLTTPQQNAAAFSLANVSAQDIYGNTLTNFDSTGEGIAIIVSGTGSVNITCLV